MSHSRLMACAVVGILVADASAAVKLYLDEIDDARIVNAVTDAAVVKTSRKDLEQLRDKLMKLKRPDLIAVLGKPAAKPPKTYAMPVAEMRALTLPGIRDAAADRPDRDFITFHPLGENAAVEVYYSRDKEGDTPLAVRFYLKPDKSIPKLTGDNLDQRLAWEKERVKKLAERISKGAAVAADDDYVKSIRTFLQDNFSAKNACIVIGFVNEHGSMVISRGELADGTGREADGDSLFLIGSVSKTFAALLLQAMVKRGEMKLNDPVAKYLPASVKMPTHGGKEITLLDLATHTAGFPINPDNMSGKDVKEQYETYTVEKMYAYVSGYTLRRDPGSEFEYSNVGMALLGHVLALKAGTDFESLVIGRICRPLHMDSTCITPTPELKTRLAIGHDKSGNPSRPWNLRVYAPAGAMHSTANDLLKYVSAQAGLTSSELVPLMEKTHAIRHTDSRALADVPGFGTFGQTAMPWYDRGVQQPLGMLLLGHAGGSGSYDAYVGFDRKLHRGVVVLTTSNDFSCEAIGWTLLQRKPLTRESATVFAPELVGIGIALDLNEQTRTLRIIKVLPNSPAAQAGLSPGFVIRRIGDLPVEGKGLAECVKLLRGNVGTKVPLELFGPDGKSKTVELTRQRILSTR